MKYIKKFEMIENKNYKDGEYILVNIYFDPHHRVDKKSKIIKNNFDSTTSYKILYDDNKTDTVLFYKIIRYLTTDEIDEFESNINAIKFNV
jgi:hypothetical protein